MLFALTCIRRSNQTQPQTGATVEPSNQSTAMMEDSKWINATGTLNSIIPGDGSCVTDPCWYNTGLPNREKTVSIIVGCSNTTSCRNFQSENVNVFPESIQDPTVLCIDATAMLNPSLGVRCENGTFASLLAGNQKRLKRHGHETVP